MKKLVYIPLSLMISTSYLFAATEAVGEKSTSKAEITNTVMTINTGEINLAKLAQSKAINPQVRDFATQMVNDHSKNNDHLHGLAAKESISPKETKDSMKLKTAGESKLEEIKKLEGKEFDKAYMTSQVDMHKQALDKLNNELIPNAKDKDLRVMLDKTKIKVEQHLKRAQEINKTL